MMKKISLLVFFLLSMNLYAQSTYIYQVPGTMQKQCSDNEKAIPCPKQGERFYGQDAQFSIPVSYKFLPDTLVYDNNTKLTWTQAYKDLSWEEAKTMATSLKLGGYSDWRIPTMKELYTLMNFDGMNGYDAKTSIPFIDMDFFYFSYPETQGGLNQKPGQRFMDVQFWSSNEYVGRTMHNDRTVFGGNFADGRIKGYPLFLPHTSEEQPHRMYVRFVRGPVNYGEGTLIDNQDGTISDEGTRLMWQQVDDGKTRNWEAALSYCEHLNLANHADWRLPNAKELHTIVDYNSNPTVNNRPALREPLQSSNIESYYWTSTTLIEHMPNTKTGNYSKAVYIAFGRAMGWMAYPPGSSHRELIDVHGAGAQRSDPKSGDPEDYPQGFGPQGDDIRIYNYVRCVR